MKHLQVPETKPNDKNTIKNVNNAAIRGPANGYISYYIVNDCKSTVFKEFLNADREVKLIRSAGKLLR